MTGLTGLYCGKVLKWVCCVVIHRVCCLCQPCGTDSDISDNAE